MTKALSIPIEKEEIRHLRAGEPVLLSGVILTGRDMAHKWLVDTFILKNISISKEDAQIIDQIKRIASGSLVYHCGPVVAKDATGSYQFTAAGPTTSIREEPYQAEVIDFLDLRGVIGKGGMGSRTLNACQKAPAVYFHAVGGAASLIAQCVIEVLDVFKLEFGIPEAIWVIRVKDLPAIVTMDSYGSSLHAAVKDRSFIALQTLIR
jgi:fumarate hydratase class I